MVSVGCSVDRGPAFSGESYGRTEILAGTQKDCIRFLNAKPDDLALIAV
jgi:hypothetical protein